MPPAGSRSRVGIERSQCRSSSRSTTTSRCSTARARSLVFDWAIVLHASTPTSAPCSLATASIASDMASSVSSSGDGRPSRDAADRTRRPPRLAHTPQSVACWLGDDHGEVPVGDAVDVRIHGCVAVLKAFAKKAGALAERAIGVQAGPPDDGFEGRRVLVV